MGFIAVVCSLWILFVVFLPRLTVWIVMALFRARALLSPRTDRGVALAAQWTSRKGMAAAAVVPPLVFVLAWVLSRVLPSGG